MKPTTFAATITARANAHFTGQRVRPAYVVGPPGVGKTQIARDIATQMGVGFIPLHGPLMLPEDYGMPMFTPDGKGIEFATPGGKFPFADRTDIPETGLLLVDEMGQADNSQQKILANLFQERELHGRKLKDGWYIIATGNRTQDRAGSNRVLSHLNDRITTYELEVSHEDWITWALTRGGVVPEVVSFLNWRPDKLAAFDPSADKSPTPRAWAEGVSRSIGMVPPEAEFDSYKGDVGEGAAAEFLGFIKTYRSLPDPDLVLSNPGQAVIPTDMSTLYALCGALAHRATQETMPNLVAYAKRLAGAGKGEFMVLLIRDAIRVNPEVVQTSAFVQWSLNEGKEMLGA